MLSGLMPRVGAPVCSRGASAGDRETRPFTRDPQVVADLSEWRRRCPAGRRRRNESITSAMARSEDAAAGRAVTGQVSHMNAPVRDCSIGLGGYELELGGGPVVLSSLVASLAARPLLRGST